MSGTATGKAKRGNKANVDSARRNYIEEQWNRFRRVISIPKEATRDEIEAVREVFYSGAWSMVIMQAENDDVRLDEVLAELDAFMTQAQVANSFGMRWAEELSRTYVDPFDPKPGETP